LALALGFSSVVRAWKGDDAIAVEQANRALRLSPFDHLLYLPYVGLAYAHFAAGRFEETVAAASLATQSNPRFSVPQICTLPRWAASTGAKKRRLRCNGYSSCSPASPSPARSSRPVT
jgi:hypothetical protein